MALIEVSPVVDPEGKKWHINPKNVTLIRPRTRYDINHVQECEDAQPDVQLLYCPVLAMQNGDTAPPKDDTFGCTAAVDLLLTEICFVSGPEASILVVDKYDEVRKRISEQT